MLLWCWFWSYYCHCYSNAADANNWLNNHLCPHNWSNPASANNKTSTMAKCHLFGPKSCITLLALIYLNCLLIIAKTPIHGSNTQANTLRDAKDPRWPHKQFNVLLDSMSLNFTQRLILDAFLEQLQHRTCLKINKLSRAPVNSSSVAHMEADYSSFVHIFKPQTSSLAKQSHFIGLSSFGCLRQGRQSMIVDELAFEFPQLVLRYHLMHTLGVANLTKPDEQVRQLLARRLPLNQKIQKEPVPLRDRTIIEGPYYTYATLFRSFQFPEEPAAGRGPQVVQAVEYLTEEDLIKLKKLYNCTDFHSRLSYSYTTSSLASSPEKHVRLIDSVEDVAATAADALTPVLEPWTRRRAKDRGSGSATDEVVAEIAGSLLEEATGASTSAEPWAQSLYRGTTSSTTSTTTTTTIASRMQPSTGAGIDSAKRLDSSNLKERPMVLKLDQFHALDPLLMQANQMKLSLLNSTSSSESHHHSSQANTLLNIGDLTSDSQESNTWPNRKSEMLISFEQSGPKQPAAVPGSKPNLDPVSSLVSGTQVLKLCSCSCQTMSPSSGPTTASPSPSSPATTGTTPAATLPATVTELQPTTAEYTPPVTLDPLTTLKPTTTLKPPPPTMDPTSPPPVTLPPSTDTVPDTDLPPITTLIPKPGTTTTTTLATTQQETSEPPETDQPTSVKPTPTTQPTQRPPTKPPVNNTSTGCELVDWVKPSKSIYSSANIVWDMDRANQNYFICQTMVNGELVPGKTHGFSCKVSSNGLAYEMHNFKVLTKPEAASLAWVQRKKSGLGKSNQPVVGGYSKSGDWYVVSRCLVRDENNDVITLIGYVNSHGVGWFPFDDIQIECAQYDVLACVT